MDRRTAITAAGGRVPPGPDPHDEIPRSAEGRGRFGGLLRDPNATLVVLVLAIGAFSACSALPVGWTGRQAGLAPWYGPGLHGRRTASGTVHTGAALTAAHRSLPFGTRVRVTNLKNGRTVVVVVDDRGPFVRGRVIDLSRAAARRLGMVSDGVVPVRLRVIRWVGEPTA